MLKHDNYILGLDIGSSKICAALCEMENGELNCKTIQTSISSGLSKKGITDVSELQSSIKRAINRIEKESGISPKHIITNMPLSAIEFSQNIGLLRQRNTDGTFTKDDQLECIKRSKNIIKGDDEKIMHVIPLYYNIDKQMTVNPVGLKGESLEVQTHIILVKHHALIDVTQAIRSLNYHIKGIIYDGLGLSQILLTDTERQEGGLLFDIGGQYSKLNIFKHNVLHNSYFIPYGSETITADIAHCLNTTIPEAERLKLTYGNLDITKIDPTKDIEILTIDTGKKHIKQRYLCQIIEARINEILTLLLKELPFSIGPTYQAVVGGAGSQLEGLGSYLKKRLSCPARVGLSENIEKIIEHPAHASAVGLVVYALKSGAITGKSGAPKPLFKQVSRWFQSFLE